MKKFVVVLAGIYMVVAGAASAFLPALFAAPVAAQAATVLLPIMAPIALSAIHGAITNAHQVLQGQCPSTCRGTAVICKTASGLSMCKGLCQKIEKVGPYEIKNRFSNDETPDPQRRQSLLITPELIDLFKEEKDKNTEYLRNHFFSLMQKQETNIPLKWSLQTCVRQRTRNIPRNVPQGNGYYDLELMDKLPKDKKNKNSPEKEKIYLKKIDNDHLQYTVINRRGKQVTKMLVIHVIEDLTDDTLKKYRFEILDALIRKGDIHSWKSIAVYNERQRQQLITLIELEKTARQIVQNNAMEVDAKALEAFLSNVPDKQSEELKQEEDKRKKVVEYAKKAIFEIQSAIEAKRNNEYGLQ